jgi:uncharacterized membrane protein YdfJ with MMPL/SSD domain
VLFGLSMDSQVFAISQIERPPTRPGRESGSRSPAASHLGARLIGAAALIMMAVFGSFVLNDDPTVKQFGVGLSLGVALAAMTVHLLAPALLVLAGAGSWWIPSWLDRTLPHIDIEGAAARPAPTALSETVDVPPAPANRDPVKPQPLRTAFFLAFLTVTVRDAVPAPAWSASPSA